MNDDNTAIGRIKSIIKGANMSHIHNNQKAKLRQNDFIILFNEFLTESIEFSDCKRYRYRKPSFFQRYSNVYQRLIGFTSKPEFIPSKPTELRKSLGVIKFGVVYKADIPNGTQLDIDVLVAAYEAALRHQSAFEYDITLLNNGDRSSPIVNEIYEEDAGVSMCEHDCCY